MGNIRGERIRVLKGRKVPIGTEGTCFWTGSGKFGPRVGLKTDSGKVYWTAMSNVRAVNGEGFVGTSSVPLDLTNGIAKKVAEAEFLANPAPSVAAEVAAENGFNENERKADYRENWGGAAGRRKKGAAFPARYKGTCKYCGTDIAVGSMIKYKNREAWHENCEPSGNPKADSEYYAGRNDAQRYLDDKSIYGEMLAERWAMEDEMARYNRGEDY